MTALPAAPRAHGRWLIAAAILFASIVVPFVVWGSALETTLNSWAQRADAPATTAWLTGLLMASDVLLPIPSSVVAVTAGMTLGWPLATVTLAFGSTAGCLLGYALGRSASHAGLGRWVGPHEHDALIRAFERYGIGTIILLRAVPVLAEASVIVAGAARMRLRWFLAACFPANVVVAYVYATVGDMSAQGDHRELGLLAGLVLPGIVMLVVWGRRSRSRHP